MDNTCLGYRNHATAVCALALANEYTINQAAKAFMLTYTGNKPYLDFVFHARLIDKRIPDDDTHYWIDNQIDYAALDLDMYAINE